MAQRCTVGVEGLYPLADSNFGRIEASVFGIPQCNAQMPTPAEGENANLRPQDQGHETLLRAVFVPV